MMKKLVLALVLIFAVAALSACDGGLPEDVMEPADSATQETESAATGETIPDETVQSEDPATAQDDEPEVTPDFALKVDDFLIEMDQDFTYVLAALGEPLDEFEAPSCAFDGIDRIFLYPDFEVRTYPKGGSDHVHTIVFTNDLVRTTEGNIRLGASLQSVIDAYGDDYKHDAGMYTFTRGLTTLEFLVDDDIVTNILYGFIIEE